MSSRTTSATTPSSCTSLKSHEPSRSSPALIGVGLGGGSFPTMAIVRQLARRIGGRFRSPSSVVMHPSVRILSPGEACVAMSITSWQSRAIAPFASCTNIDVPPVQTHSVTLASSANAVPSRQWPRSISASSRQSCALAQSGAARQTRAASCGSWGIWGHFTTKVACGNEMPDTPFLGHCNWMGHTLK